MEDAVRVIDIITGYVPNDEIIESSRGKILRARKSVQQVKKHEAQGSARTSIFNDLLRIKKNFYKKSRCFFGLFDLDI